MEFSESNDYGEPLAYTPRQSQFRGGPGTLQPPIRYRPESSGLLDCSSSLSQLVVLISQERWAYSSAASRISSRGGDPQYVTGACREKIPRGMMSPVL